MIRRDETLHQLLGFPISALPVGCDSCCLNHKPIHTLGDSLNNIRPPSLHTYIHVLIHRAVRRRGFTFPAQGSQVRFETFHSVYFPAGTMTRYLGIETARCTR